MTMTTPPTTPPDCSPLPWTLDECAGIWSGGAMIHEGATCSAHPDDCADIHDINAFIVTAVNRAALFDELVSALEQLRWMAKQGSDEFSLQVANICAAALARAKQREEGA